jgi:hypothetical protein
MLAMTLVLLAASSSFPAASLPPRAERGHWVELVKNEGAAGAAPPPVLAPTASGSGNGRELPPVPLPGATGPRTEVLIAGGATAGAALIAGVVFTVLANQRTSEAEEKNGELIKAMRPTTCAQPTDACREVGGLIHDRVVFTNVAGVSFIGAGALAVATGIYAFAAKRAPKAGVYATPVVTGQSAAVIVTGVW